MIFVPEPSARVVEVIESSSLKRCPDTVMHTVTSRHNGVYTISDGSIVYTFARNGYMVSRGTIFSLTGNTSVVVVRHEYKLKDGREAERSMSVIRRDNASIYVGEVVSNGNIRGTYVYTDSCLFSGLINKLAGTFQRCCRTGQSVSYEMNLFSLLRLARVI